MTPDRRGRKQGGGRQRKEDRGGDRMEVHEGREREWLERMT